VQFGHSVSPLELVRFADSAPLLRPPPRGIFAPFQTVPFRPGKPPLNLRAYRQARRVQVEVMQFSKAEGPNDDFSLRRCLPGR
jgi:hypothetical protein